MIAGHSQGIVHILIESIATSGRQNVIIVRILEDILEVGGLTIHEGTSSQSGNSFRICLIVI